jgi:two-component system, NarL family, nitrate/nitrite response regulator NarL
MRASDRGPSRPDDRFGRLPPREHEVALLVAAGLPNAEIARQLGLSPSTVGTYLQHIRQRLDLRTRLEIAAWVHACRSPDDPEAC